MTGQILVLHRDHLLVWNYEIIYTVSYCHLLICHICSVREQTYSAHLSGSPCYWNWFPYGGLLGENPQKDRFWSGRYVFSHWTEWAGTRLIIGLWVSHLHRRIGHRVTKFSTGTATLFRGIEAGTNFPTSFIELFCIQYWCNICKYEICSKSTGILILTNRGFTRCAPRPSVD